MTNFAKGAGDAYIAIKSMTRALDFLNIRRKQERNFLWKIKKEEILRNPAYFRDFLVLEEWKAKDEKW